MIWMLKFEETHLNGMIWEVRVSTEWANKLWFRHFSCRKEEQRKRRMEWIQRLYESMRTAMTHLILVKKTKRIYMYVYHTHSKSIHLFCAWVLNDCGHIDMDRVLNVNEMEILNTQYVEATIHPCMCITISDTHRYTIAVFVLLLLSP